MPRVSVPRSIVSRPPLIDAAMKTLGLDEAGIAAIEKELLDIQHALEREGASTLELVKLAQKCAEAAGSAPAGGRQAAFMRCARAAKPDKGTLAVGAIFGVLGAMVLVALLSKKKR